MLELIVLAGVAARVPDSGTTLSLLTLALGSLALIRSKIKK